VAISLNNIKAANKLGKVDHGIKIMIFAAFSNYLKLEGFWKKKLKKVCFTVLYDV
jgi:hypothetical protein